MIAAVLCILAAGGGRASSAPDSCAVRVATFNVALNFPEPGGLAAALAGGTHDPARRIAAVIQRVRPDVLLLNEVDHDPEMAGLGLLRDAYLGTGQFGEAPIRYPHAFHAPMNTGVPSGLDLDGDGRVGGPGDAWGFGRFPGQYGMVVLSRLPIATDRARTFQRYRWADLPGARLPVHPDSGAPFYPPDVATRLRLSSKSHWDVPVRLPDGNLLHLLASHPTPPVFDGPEDRNGLRNRDEIRFWELYLDDSDAIVDDGGRRGGLPADASFVIAGDLNADPHDGDSTGRPIASLLAHPRVDGAVVPRSAGAVAKATLDGGANETHRSEPAADTADFGDRGPGNLRIDYVLPATGLDVLDAGVFWPLPGDPAAAWVEASDSAWSGSIWPVRPDGHPRPRDAPPVITEPRPPAAVIQ